MAMKEGFELHYIIYIYLFFMKFYNTSYYIQANEMTEAVGQLNLYSAPIVILFYNGKEIHRQARIIDFSELDYRIKQTL